MNKKNTGKKRRVLLTIFIILVIAFGVFGIIKNNKKEIELTKVKDYNYFVLKKNDLYGVMDKAGNIIINPEYEKVEIPNPEKSLFICYKNEKCIIKNENREDILKQFETVEDIRLKNIVSDLMYEKNVLKYSENGKYGLINFNGKAITKPIYDQIESLSYKEGYLLVKQNEKYGVINIKGKKIVNTEYDQIVVDGYYTDEKQYGYAGYIVSNKTENGYRYGYINYKGKLVVDLDYNELSRINDTNDEKNVYLIGAKNGQYGVICNGKEMIPNEYQSVRYDSSNNILVVEKSKKYGIMNLEGKVIVPVEYSQIDINGIYLYAKNSQGVTVYNNNGTQANINTNVTIINTNNEKYRIRINSEDETKYGIIGKDGKQLVEEKYKYLEYLYDDFFIAGVSDGKLGIIDYKENVKVNIIYDSIQKVTGTDLIQVIDSKSNMLEVYDRNMNNICKMKNATIEAFDNYIKISNDEEAKYFSKEGNELTNKDVFSGNRLYAYSKDGKWGFVDKNDNVLLEVKYDKVTEFNKYGFAGIQKDGKWGVINDKGEVIIEPIYEFSDGVEPNFIYKYYEVKYGFGEIYYTDEQ